MNLWEGKRVLLRAVEPADWEAFASFDKDTAAQQLGYRVEFPRSTAAAQQWASDRAAEHSDFSSDSAFFAVSLPGGPLLGSINAHACDRRNGVFEYGVTLGREHWGNGYAGDALCVLLRFFFGELRYQKVNAGVYEFNTRSQRFHERFGFVLEGRLRRSIFVAARHFDELWYGMTIEEFSQKHPDFAPGPPS